MNKYADYVRQTLPMRDLLEQLAEECKEPANASSKLISDYCRHTKCNKCMFDYYGDCMFTHWNDENAWDYTPRFWDTTGIREE